MLCKDTHHQRKLVSFLTPTYSTYYITIYLLIPISTTAKTTISSSIQIHFAVSISSASCNQIGNKIWKHNNTAYKILATHFYQEWSQCYMHLSVARCVALAVGTEQFGLEHLVKSIFWYVHIRGLPYIVCGTFGLWTNYKTYLCARLNYCHISIN